MYCLLVVGLQFDAKCCCGLFYVVCLDVGTTGAVQNLRIIHGADGQIQVQGLLPGLCYYQ